MDRPCGAQKRARNKISVPGGKAQNRLVPPLLPKKWRETQETVSSECSFLNFQMLGIGFSPDVCA
jgi:hypothetical protein